MQKMHSLMVSDPQPSVVPSIATQYTRSRKAHDRTAREWTELYARPPPKMALPTVHLTSIASSTGKGKGRAQDQPANTNQIVSNNGSSTSNAKDPILLLSDSESESTTRSTHGTTRKRKRTEGVHVEIDLSGEPSEENDGGSRKFPNGKRRKSGAGTNITQGSGEVIIIEDD
jgi:hypothetical protein